MPKTSSPRPAASPRASKVQRTDSNSSQNTESTFCPYSETSKAYDQTRYPLGIGCTMGSFAISKWPLNKQKFLDVGGGTGTFMELVHDKFASATLFEANAGMLEQAEARLGKKVTLKK